MNWKKKKQKLPNSPVDYPTGVCVKSEEGWFYIKGNVRFRIKHKRILDSWNFPRIIDTTEAALKKYKIAGSLGFRSGSLINVFSDDKLYVIAGAKKRLITNPDYLDHLGISLRDFTNVSLTEANFHEDGPDIL